MFLVTDCEAAPTVSGRSWQHSGSVESLSVQKSYFQSAKLPGRDHGSSAAPGSEVVKIDRILDVSRDGFQKISDGHQLEALAVFDY